VQDPERYLTGLGLSVPCAVNPKRKGKIEPALRREINHEIYYFADAGTLRRFDRDPLRYCGLVTDPASRARFRPTPGSPQLDYMGRRYYFATDSTCAVFTAMPDSFAVRRGM